MPAPHRPAPVARAPYIRAITAEDSARLADAFAGLSDRSRYQRFLSPKPRLSSAELRYLTDIDHRTHEALVAVDPSDGSLVGVARYAGDAWQGRGIGTRLLRELVARAEANGISDLSATTLHDNPAARALLRRVGFRTRSISGGLVELGLELTPRAQAA
jgi:ribosomal protein S18 acetylase RimI-like enzyme